MNRQDGRVQVRAVGERDLAELAELVYGYIDFYRRPRPERERVMWLLRTLLEQPGLGQQLAAFVDGRMVGFATLYFTFSTLQTRPVAVLNDLYVAPEARRDGVGTALFEACLELVGSRGLRPCSRGFVHMEWVTAPDNETAQALYEKMGARRGDWLSYSI